MAASELETLTAPVSDEEPCGPDLDLNGDVEYMNYMARAEGLLPTSFFREGKPFDRNTINFGAEFEAVKPFLEQTRDLRLMTLLARFHLLNRDLSGFETSVRAIATLLAERWDEVHPRGEDGNFTIRMAALETLDDSPTVVFPLQFVPVVNNRRFGAVTFRDYMIAKGEAKPVTGDDSPEPIDLATIDKTLMETELEPLVATLRQFESARDALVQIRKQWIEHAGFDQVVTIDKAPETIGRIIALLQDVAVRRDPSLAPAEPAAEEATGTGTDAAAASPIAAGSIRSLAEAAGALAAVAAYFDRQEPSSPALLLVRQAQQLIGKSFVDALRIMMPTAVGQAAVAVGAPLPFKLSLEALSQMQAPPGNGGWADGQAAAGEPQTPGGDKSPLRADDRQTALALLQEIGAYYRVAEPSSPISILVERGRKLAEQDFMGLLQEFLPESFRPPTK
jgi:type VI secretion system protein ImpA